jgi:hypothetical protein
MLEQRSILRTMRVPAAKCRGLARAAPRLGARAAAAAPLHKAAHGDGPSWPPCALPQPSGYRFARFLARCPQAALLLMCPAAIVSQGGNTPLIWAAYSGSLDVMRLLLERGADTQVTYKKARPLRAAQRPGLP